MSDKTLELLTQFREAKKKLKGNTVFKHFKGGTYKILGTLFDATKDRVVYVYKRIDGPEYDEALEKDIFFTRTVDEWFSYADSQRTIKRFVALS